MKKLAGKRLAVIAGGLSVVLAAGVAFAAWTANGTGSGNAKALSAQTITATGATAVADLYPGGPAGAVYFTLTNDNPYNVHMDKLTGLTLTSSGTCPADQITLADTTTPIAVGPAGPPAGFAAAHNATTGTLSIPSLVTLLHTAGDNCQGQDIVVHLTFTGSQD